MSDETQSLTPPDSSPEERLERVLAEYLRQVEQGAEVDQQALLVANPDLADDLREFFANQARMQQLVGAGPARGASNGAVPRKLKYFGDYEILEEIAHGGMGVVYKARQTTLNRIVAVKMILAGQLANESDVKRFQAEAEAAANLHHPGIVGIHEVGVQDGQHYYSMEYIDGQNLAQIVREKPLPITTAAEYVRDIATVLEYAHQKGILHRDLKPSNILLDASGRLRITDFGLAKRVEGESDLTMTGQVLGTPSYMSPEQAAAQHAIIGPPTDIYALGAILYELITGRPPFRSESIGEILRQVQHDEPVRPRLLNPKLPRDLETICLKCLEKEPRRRYGSAQLLADDLGRYLRGEPILARPISRPARLWRWCRRKPVVAGLIMGLASSLSGGTIISAYFAFQSNARATAEAFQRGRATDKAAEAGRERAIAERRLAQSERLLYASQIARARLEWDSGRINAAWASLNACRRDLRDWEHDYLYTLLTSNQRTLRGHSDLGDVTAAFSLDGRRLISCNLAETKIWDVNTGKVLRTISGGTSCAVFSPDQRHAFYGNAIWNADTGEQAWPLKSHVGIIECVAYNSDGRWLVSGGQDATLRVWNSQTGQEILTINTGCGEACRLAVSPDGRWIASCCRDGTLQIWDAKSGKQIHTLQGHIGRVLSVAFSPDSRRVVSGGNDKTLKTWNAETGHEVLTFKGHTNAVSSVTFSPNGERILSGSWDQTLRIWNAETAQELWILKGHSDDVSSVGYSADGRWIVSGAADNTVKLWDAAVKQETQTLDGHTGEVNSVAFSPDGGRIASGSSDNTVRIWDSSTGQTIATLTGHTDSVRSIAFSPDGDRIASAGYDNLVRIWNCSTGLELLALKGHTEGVNCVAFSANGMSLASASNDNTVKLWDTAAGIIKLTLKGHGPKSHSASGVHSVAFSPNGRRLASGADDKTVRVWDTVTGKQLLILNGHTSVVTAVVYSRDGNWIASGGKDRTVRLWNAATGRELLVLAGHAQAVKSVAFSPNLQRIVTSSEDNTLRVWETTTGQEVLTLTERPGDELYRRLNCAAFSPDGQRIISGGGGNDDGAVQKWDGSRSPRNTEEATAVQTPAKGKGEGRVPTAQGTK